MGACSQGSLSQDVRIRSRFTGMNMNESLFTQGGQPVHCVCDRFYLHGQTGGVICTLSLTGTRVCLHPLGVQLFDLFSVPGELRPQ